MLWTLRYISAMYYYYMFVTIENRPGLRWIHRAHYYLRVIRPSSFVENVILPSVKGAKRKHREVRACYQPFLTCLHLLLVVLCPELWSWFWLHHSVLHGCKRILNGQWLESTPCGWRGVQIQVVGNELGMVGFCAESDLHFSREGF